MSNRQNNKAQNILSEAKRIIVKIGSSLLVELKEDIYKLRKEWLNNLIDDLNKLLNSDKDIIIVTSGAIAAGKKYLNKKENFNLGDKQAAAACGQTDITLLYKNKFNKIGKNIAQILLTLEDTEDRRRYINAKTTIETLLQNNVIPIINENDTIATDEIRFGDNDRLSARIAQMVEADTLILLSDVDGLYDKNPNNNPDAKHITKINQIDEKILNMAGKEISLFGSGGMKTKLEAAIIARSSGCKTIITSGVTNNPITKLQNNTVKFTEFIPDISPVTAKKQWLAANLRLKGEIILDSGATKAVLHDGNSILPSGIKNISGSFERGDSIAIKNLDKKEIARGITEYSALETKEIIGKNSREIENILGYTRGDAVIHRNNMALV